MVPARSGTAFALSGGGSHGAAQVGMLRALFEAGIVPDALVGCSVGALNAAYVAADPTPARVQTLGAIWSTMTARTVFGTPRRATLWNIVTRRDHIFTPDRLMALIDRLCPVPDLADLRVATHVVTTDLDAGRPTWWTAGPARRILAASACLPALFPPVLLPGPDGSTRRHVDGGVAAPVPVARATSLGVRTVYVLDVSGEHAGAASRMTALEVLLRSFTISRYANLPDPTAMAGPGQEVVVLPCPDIGAIGIRDFRSTASMMTAAYELAAEFLAGRMPMTAA